MDIATVRDLIQNLAFPIALCVILLWYIYKRDKDSKEQISNIISTLTEAHKTEVVELKETSENTRKALENNTIILTKVYELLQSRG